jgi:hypothetical protein
LEVLTTRKEIPIDKVMEMLETAKNKHMIEINNDMDVIGKAIDKSTNYGVWVMFYEMQIALLNYETEKEG